MVNELEIWRKMDSARCPVYPRVVGFWHSAVAKLIAEFMVSVKRVEYKKLAHLSLRNSYESGDHSP